MLTPHVLWALRNGEPLEPAQRRVARHLGFWAVFAYVEMFAYDLIAPELVMLSAVVAIACALFEPLRARTSFLAMHAALIVSLSMTVWRAPDATTVVDLFLLVLLVIASLPALLPRGAGEKVREARMRGAPHPAVGHPLPAEAGRGVLRSLLLLHALTLFVDPWSFPLSTLTSAHFVARALAIVMVLSMLFIRRPLPRVAEVPIAPSPPSLPVSAAEWDRATR